MKTLMVQGTTSDAGKSTLVAGLCRVFARKGFKVAPFKPQNMALNSAVTPCGGEIGRAQALQAIAANTPLQTDFNPVLLKPNSDTGAQVIIHGRAISNMEADTYHDYKKVALDAVLTSHTRLSNVFSWCLVEGAGSPAEINLRENDIANMGFACEVDAPVIIIADIDKGGVFAHLVGTLALLSEYEQSLVKGFVINRFRGDIALLEPGLEWLEKETGKPVLGVLPYVHDLALDAEDAVNIENRVNQSKIKINVLLLPHISNHTDFDSLRLNEHVDIQYIRMGEQVTGCDLLIIPGSKNVVGDLIYLREQGWDEAITKHLRYGGKVLGICGGLQILGEEIHDPDTIETTLKKVKALHLAEFKTTLLPDKVLTNVTGHCLLGGEKTEIAGYEIHSGRSIGPALNRPFLRFQDHPNETIMDGFISEDNQIAGTYLHGLFDLPESTQAVLKWVKPNFDGVGIDLAAFRELQIERLADICEAHLDIDKLIELGA